MSFSQRTARAVQAINDKGALLVFPVKNAPEPDSIWRSLYPRSVMRWEWDENGSQKVSDTWRLMKALSERRDIIYSKWYQNRATFFSRPLFQALLHRSLSQWHSPLGPEARRILEVLEMDSPLSTRDVKKLTELQGRYFEGAYNRGMSELFQKFLIIGFGEVDDGAFPSLAVGATRTLQEDLWMEAEALSSAQADAIIDEYLPEGSKFRVFLERQAKKWGVSKVQKEFTEEF